MILLIAIVLTCLFCLPMIIPSPGTSSLAGTGGALLVGNKIIDGELPTPGPAGLLYTCPSNVQSATIMTVTLVNTTGGALTTNLYVNANGTDRKIIDSDKSLAATGAATGNRFAELIGISVPQGGTIKGDASGAGVTYVIQLLEIPAVT